MSKIAAESPIPDRSGPLNSAAGLCKPAENARGKLLSVSFLGLVATQFFVALTDNMFRWLIVPIGSELLGYRELALSICAACFIVPFLIFAAPAGYLADRFSKRNVMIVCKAVEIAVLCLGIASILLQNVYLMFVVLFLLGGQSSIFITSKMGVIPEMFGSKKIAAANGVINMASMGAIIIGTILGGFLYDLTTPFGLHNWWISAMALLGVSVVGFLTSLTIAPMKSENPVRRFPWNPVTQTVRDIRLLWCKRPLFLAAVASTFFWTLGMLSQANIYLFAKESLHIVPDHQIGLLLGALTIGIGIGAVLAGICSRGKVELGLVPLGAAGMAIAAMLMAFVPGGVEGHPLGAGFYCSCSLLFVLGIAAGMYDIPLQAFIQDRSPAKSRGSIMAAYNFMTFSGMLAASGLFWMLSGPLGLSPRVIFFIGGLATLPVTLLIVGHLPFQTVRLATQLLVGCFYRVRIEGEENIPEGGALLVANHISWLDGVLFGLACPRHPRMIAYADYFNNRWLNWFGRVGRIIPIGPTRKSMVESIRAARGALQDGELVGIFPEGGITRTGQLAEFRPGFLSILKETGAPVVPVYLGGLWGSVFSYEGGKFFWKLPKRWRYPVSIRFGQPIHAPEGVDQVRRAVEELQCVSD